MVTVMADDALSDRTRELIQGLCLEAGRIMEDVSSEMPLTFPDDHTSIAERVELLHRAAEDIFALSGAARALLPAAS